jgi:hypothetical protein
MMAQAMVQALSAALTQMQRGGVPDFGAPVEMAAEEQEGEGVLEVPDILRFMLAVQGGGAGAGPGPWARAEWERLLNTSMADLGGVKTVASDEGLDQVKRWVYRVPKPEDSDEPPTDEPEVGKVAPDAVCAITQMPFEDGDEIAEMPCGHQFDCDNLMHWLKRESAACPVCRKEVASREVARSPEEQEGEEGMGSEGGAAAGAGGGPGAGAAVGGPAAGVAVGIPVPAGLLQPLLGPRMGVPQMMSPSGRYVPHGPGAAVFQRTPQQRLGAMAIQRTAEVERLSEDDQIEQAILEAVMRDSMRDA